MDPRDLRTHDGKMVDPTRSAIAAATEATAAGNSTVEVPRPGPRSRPGPRVAEVYAAEMESIPAVQRSHWESRGTEDIPRERY